MLEPPLSQDVFKLTLLPADAPPGAQGFTFPIEPKVSASSRNRIIRKYPQRSLRGSIKERWIVDDYEVAIRATFIAEAGYLEGLQKQSDELLEDQIRQAPSAGATPDLETALRQRLQREVDRLRAFIVRLCSPTVEGISGEPAKGR